MLFIPQDQNCHFKVIIKIFYMPISSLIPNFFDYKFWNNNKYIWNQKIYVESYKMHLFCYSFKKSKLANNHFISPSKRKKRWSPSLKSIKKSMQISFPKFWIGTYYSMSIVTLTCSENTKLYEKIRVCTLEIQKVSMESKDLMSFIFHHPSFIL